MAKFLKSQKGAFHLVHDGLRFKKNGKGSATNQPWRCVEAGCKGKASTPANPMEGCLVVHTGTHSHAPDPAKIEVLGAVQAARIEAVEQPGLAPRRVLSDVVVGLSAEAAGRLPTADKIKRTIQRVRNRNEAFPAAPGNVNNLRIPHQFRVTGTGERFLLYDNHEDLPEDESDEEDNEDEKPPRIVMFASDDGLQCLKDHEHWFYDGTFKVSPRLFYQIFVIHALVLGTAVPCVFSMLGNKTGESYRSIPNPEAQTSRI